MNRLNNYLMGIVLSSFLVLTAVNNIDTDRRVVPVFETLKILYMDMKAQYQAETQGTLDAVTLIYNNGGHGTAFFITENTLLTNHHMVARKQLYGGISKETNDYVTIQLRNGMQVGAKVLKSNPDMDIALLEIVGEYKSPYTLSLSETLPDVGSSIYIAGNGGYDFFWAKGGILRHQYVFSGLWNNSQQLATMRSKGGFSGSPVIDSATGKVIGVHAGGASSVSLAIHVPLADIKAFLKRTASQNNPYKSKEISDDLQLERWQEFPETPGNTKRFVASPQAMQRVDHREVRDYSAHFNIISRGDPQGTMFKGPTQATTHLLQHIYFGDALKIPQPDAKVVFTALYVPQMAILEEMRKPLAEFVKRRGIKVKYVPETRRVVFIGIKKDLLDIAGYIFRGKELPTSGGGRDGDFD